MQCVYLQLIAAAKVDPQLGDTFQRVLHRTAPPVAHPARAGRRPAELPADIDMDLVQDLLVAPFVYRWLFTDRQVDPGVVAKLVDVVLAGVCASAAHT